MSEKIHGLAQLLPGKSSLNDCNLEELRHLAKRYPFFAPAQFLLLQKLKETGSPDYEAQYQKAVLYYPDPLQFDYFVSTEKFRFADNDSTETTAIPFPLHELDAVLPSAADLAEEEQAPAAPPAENAISVSLSEETQTENELLLPTSTLANTVVSDFPEPDKTSIGSEADSPEPSVLVTRPFHDHVLADEEKPFEEVDLTASPTSAATESPLTPPAVEDAPLPIATNSTADAKSENNKADASTPAAETLTFEPYHTVDYFASQGIKISNDSLPKDKLSKQLRSFTEWLKVMKRLPAAELQQATQSPAEKNVENLANHSVAGGDVVTEAMAEVWAKQGAREKAIETYNKLSLLNPSKKAYFAAKIENLSRS